MTETLSHLLRQPGTDNPILITPMGYLLVSSNVKTEREAPLLSFTAFLGDDHPILAGTASPEAEADYLLRLDRQQVAAFLAAGTMPSREQGGRSVAGLELSWCDNGHVCLYAAALARALVLDDAALPALWAVLSDFAETGGVAAEDLAAHASNPLPPAAPAAVSVPAPVPPRFQWNLAAVTAIQYNPATRAMTVWMPGWNNSFESTSAEAWGALLQQATLTQHAHVVDDGGLEYLLARKAIAFVVEHEANASIDVMLSNVVANPGDPHLMGFGVKLADPAARQAAIAQLLPTPGGGRAEINEWKLATLLHRALSAQFDNEGYYDTKLSALTGCRIDGDLDLRRLARDLLAQQGLPLVRHTAAMDVLPDGFRERADELMAGLPGTHSWEEIVDQLTAEYGLADYEVSRLVEDHELIPRP